MEPSSDPIDDRPHPKPKKHDGFFTSAVRLFDAPFIIRCGVIPFTIKKDKNGNPRRFYLLARDSQTKDFGDFGGGRKVHEGGLSCAYREFVEETRSLFNGVVTFEKMSESLAFVNERYGMAIIFVYIDPSWKTSKIYETFRSLKPMGKTGMEISSVQWVNEKNFIAFIKGDKAGMWTKIASFFRTISSRMLISTLNVVTYGR